MKRTSYYLSFVALIMLFASSCKKEKTPEIFFSAPSSSVDENGSSTVSIELSEASNNVVEVTFQSIGSNPVEFGSYEGVFMRDDSEKVEAKIDPQAYIDSAGTIKIIPGTKRVLITFKEKGDAFAHAPANFAIKMVSAVNGNIRQGSDTYTYNISGADAEFGFSSQIVFTDTIRDMSGTYVLQSSDYTKNGNGNYDLSLNYGTQDENMPATLNITLENVVKFEVGTNTVDCNNNTIRISFPNNSGTTTLSCTDIYGVDIDMPVDATKTPSPIYGTYMVFDGTMDIKASNYLFKGTLNGDYLPY